MELKTSFESVRDFASDVLAAGKLACASVIQKIDERMCDYGNSEDESV